MSNLVDQLEQMRGALASSDERPESQLTQQIEQMRRRIELIGEFKQMLLVSFGGLPLDTVQRSLKLIADEVIPEVNKIAAEAARARTAAPVGAQ